MAIMNERSGENSDALSRRRKRRGKDDIMPAATPNVSIIFRDSVSFLLFGSNVDTSYAGGACYPRRGYREIEASDIHTIVEYS